MRSTHAVAIAILVSLAAVAALFILLRPPPAERVVRPRPAARALDAPASRFNPSSAAPSSLQARHPSLFSSAVGPAFSPSTATLAAASPDMAALLPTPTPPSPEEAEKRAAREAYERAQAQAEVYGGCGAENQPAANYVLDGVVDEYDVQDSFDRAAAEFGVPADLLKALAFVESRGDHRGGRPSIDGGYGVMNLRENSQHNTLAEAARLLKVDPSVLVRDPVENIRGAAALLKAYHDDAVALRTPINPWIEAISLYSGFTEEQAVNYARRIEELLAAGLDAHTGFGGPITIRPNQQLLAAGLQSGGPKGGDSH